MESRDCEKSSSRTSAPCSTATTLLPVERKAIEDRDFRTLYDLGMHPYLGGQLSRFIWGNDAGKGAVEASNKLVASLQGHTRDIPKS